MAINIIPVPAASQVGPTNTDVANAVASNSNVATTISSNVPSASTIATAVAGAVPTISAINTSVANNAPSPSNWTVISTIAVTSQTTLTFSGLSGYKTYKLVGVLSPSSVSQMIFRLNNDSGGNYYSTQQGWVNGQNPSYISRGAASTAFSATYVQTSSSNYFSIDINIYSANTSAMKFVDGKLGYYDSGQSTNGYGILMGEWLGSSAITRIDVLQNSGSYNGGTLTLLGAN
jgi:hypothetical protein